MKKFISMMLAILVVVGCFAACGGNKETSDLAYVQK